MRVNHPVWCPKPGRQLSSRVKKVEHVRSKANCLITGVMIKHGRAGQNTFSVYHAKTSNGHRPQKSPCSADMLKSRGGGSIMKSVPPPKYIFIVANCISHMLL